VTLRALLICLLVVAGTLAAAPSHAWLLPYRPESVRSLVEIFEDIETSGADAALARDLERFVAAHPKGDDTDEALMRLARVYTELKENARAARSYERLLERFPASAFKTEALLELARVRYAAGDLKAARSLAVEAERSGTATIAMKVRARNLVKDIDEALEAYGPELDGPAIGVMLPLKGRYRQYGEASLRGILLAAEVFGERYGAVTVHVRDVESDPEAALDAVSELTEGVGVVGLVGPLLSATSTEVAEYAQKKRVPLVTLSQKEGITRVGDYVFRNFLTPAQQAASVAEYAIGVMGYDSFAVLHPDNTYGIEMAELFAREVESRGAHVVRTRSYEYGNSDFSEEISYLFDIVVEKRSEGRRFITEYTPTEDIDAVFMPDTFEAAGLAASYFDYYNIEGVRLLGTNGWNSPDFAVRGGSHVEGAIFVDGYFAGSDRPGTSDFTRRYRETYGVWPGVLEAQAYDAARVMITAIHEEAARLPDRRELRKRLKGMGSFEGAAGRMTFDDEGEAVRELFVLTIDHGRIVEAPETMPEPAPEAEFDFVLPSPEGTYGIFPALVEPEEMMENSGENKEEVGEDDGANAY